MKKLLLTVLMSFALFAGEGFYNKGDVKGVTVELSSQKVLNEGDNDITIKLSKDGKAITDAKVKVKFFMPEMPGMPYMESKSVAKLDGDVYKTKVNFSMGGTWQYHVLFKIDNKKYRYKGSVNLGQASSSDTSSGNPSSCGAGKCGAGKCGGGK